MFIRKRRNFFLREKKKSLCAFSKRVKCKKNKKLLQQCRSHEKHLTTQRVMPTQNLPYIVSENKTNFPLKQENPQKNTFPFYSLENE